MSGTFVEPPWPHDPSRLGDVRISMEDDDRQRLDDVKKTYKDVTTSLDELSKTFGTFAERIQEVLGKSQPQSAPSGLWPGGGWAGGRGPSPAASVASGGGAGSGGTGGGGGGGGGGGSAGGADTPPPGDPGANASVTSGFIGKMWSGARSGVGGMGFAGPNINQYERGQIRLGTFPSYGLAQALFTASWMTGTLGWGRMPEETKGMGADDLQTWAKTNNGQSYLRGIGAPQGEDGTFQLPEIGTTIKEDDQGNWFRSRRPILTTASNYLGASAQLALRALPMISKVRNFSLQQAITGSQTGYSTSGWLSTPFMSPAMRHGLGLMWRGGLQSWFGANPNYPLQQAMEAQNTINASGYRGKDANLLANQMQQLWQNNHFLTPELAMQLLDPLMRYGGAETPQDLAKSLNDLAGSAKAAHLGLQQLTQDLAQTALGVTQQTGMDIGASTGALASISEVTRATPSALSGMFSSQNLIMGAAITGTPISDVIMKGKNTAAAALALPMLKARMMMGGMSIQQFHSLQKSNPQMATQLLNRLSYAYAQDQNVFGGLNPRQILYMMATQHPGTTTPTTINLAADRAAILYGTLPPQVTAAGRAQALMDMKSQHALTVAGITHDIREFGGTASRQIYKDFMTNLGEHGGKITPKDYQDIRKSVLKDMHRWTGQNENQAAKQVVITLDPWARQLLKLKNGDPSATNKNDPWYKKALSTVEEGVIIASKIDKYLPFGGG